MSVIDDLENNIANAAEKIEILSPKELEDFSRLCLKDSQKDVMRKEKKKGIYDKLRRYCLQECKIPESFKDFVPDDEYRVVLLGKTGSGKSATGNTLLGITWFSESGTSISYTDTVRFKDCKLRDGKPLHVVDTPGIFDNRKVDKEIKFELAKVALTFPKGVHAFLFVVNATDCRFTKQENEIVTKLEETFGASFYDYSILVLTYADAKFKDNSNVRSLEEFINGEDVDTDFKAFLDKMGDRIIAVSNDWDSQFGKACQSRVLRNMIRNVPRKIKGKVYTNEFLKKALQIKSHGTTTWSQMLKSSRFKNNQANQGEGFLNIQHDVETAQYPVAGATTGDENTPKTDPLQELQEKIPPFVEDYVRSLTHAELEAVKVRNYISLRSKEGDLFAKLSEDTRRQLGNYENIEDIVIAYVNQHEEQLTQLVHLDFPCFPGDSEVVCKHRGRVAICNVHPGDKILTINGNDDLVYEDVFMLSHAHPSCLQIYKRIITENGKQLVISGGHFVSVGIEKTLKPAEDVMVGETVLTIDDNECNQSKVISITDVLRLGAYCPHTIGGKIVVDGVLASCYTTFLRPKIAHSLLLPIRLAYSFLPSSWFNFILPYDLHEGMPCLMARYKELFQKCLQIVYPS